MSAAARTKAWVCGRSLDGGCRFEYRGRHGCLSVVSFVCCQVDVSVTDWSLVQRRPTDYCASLCYRETSIMNRPWSSSIGISDLHSKIWQEVKLLRSKRYWSSPVHIIPIILSIFVHIRFTFQFLFYHLPRTVFYFKRKWPLCNIYCLNKTIRYGRNMQEWPLYIN